MFVNSPYLATITSGNIFDSMKENMFDWQAVALLFCAGGVTELTYTVYVLKNFLDFPFSNTYNNAASIRLLNLCT